MAAQHLPATVLGYSSRTWELTKIDLLNIPSLPDKCYIFLSKPTYLEAKIGRGDLLHYFDMPDNPYTRTSSGYFSYKGIYNVVGKLESYTTWFRCSVKMVYMRPDPRESPYQWFEMDFFTRWTDPSTCTVMCIDTPEELQSKLMTTLLTRSSPLDFRDPLAMHVPLTDQIMLQYDDSLWRIRDMVRSFEKRRLSDLLSVGLNEMHDFYRHAINVSEVISVTIGTIERIQQQQNIIYQSLSSKLAEQYREQAQEDIRCQLQMMMDLKLRLNGIHQRLINEMTLIVNNAILTTAKATLQATEATLQATKATLDAARDTSSMKIITFLTTLFLPFTFMAVLLTTPIFKWPDPPEGQVVVTLPFMIYWTASFVLAVIVGSVIWLISGRHSWAMALYRHIQKSVRGLW